MKPRIITPILGGTLLTLLLTMPSACSNTNSDAFSSETPVGDPGPADAFGEPQPGTGDEPTGERARQLVDCMRENGAPDFPDPEPDGSFDPDKFANLDVDALQQLFFERCSEFSLGRH